MLRATSTLTALRQRITARVIDILASYRLLCERGEALTKLLLPDTLKLLPAYASALLSTHALTRAPTPPDARAAAYVAIITSPVYELIANLYPLLVRLDDPASSHVALRLSRRALSSSGVYAFLSPARAWIYVGATVAPPTMAALFGSADPHSLAAATDFPLLDNDFSAHAHASFALLRSDIEARSGRAPHFRIVPAGSVHEPALLDLCIEDQAVANNSHSSLSYTDYMRLVHTGITKRVKAELAKPRK